jgi:hypothetical protein
MARSLKASSPAASGRSTVVEETIAGPPEEAN